MKTNTPTENGIKIGRNIYNLLVEKGKTQRDAANEMGISYSALSAWITGKRIPRMDNVDAMCDYFGCSRAKIIEGKDPDPQYTLSDGAVIEIKPTGFYAKYCRLSVHDQQVVESLVETLLNKKSKRE